MQVAQVDSRYLLGTRDWTEIEVPAAHLGARQGASTPGARCRARRRRSSSSPSATVTDPEALRRDGIATRKRGWAVTHDELEVGLTGIAVPVQGPRGDVVAALGISGPTARLEDRLDELGRNLSSHASRRSPACCAAEPARPP